MIEKKCKEYFKGKKITLMGLGLLGGGVGDAKFLLDCGADVLVTDLKDELALRDSIKKLSKYKNVSFHLGGHKLEDFKNRDLILKSAGVPLDSIYTKEAKKNKIPVEMSASLFKKLSNVPMIAVTGTRGKSTVTQMISHILSTSGKKVLLGGNVLGVSNLDLLRRVKDADIAVFELDSWQLQGFGDAKMSPNISVFTTFYPDHLNYYKDSLEKYFKDKANIFLYQKSGDTLVLGRQMKKFFEEFSSKNNFKSKARIIIPNTKLKEGFSLRVPGEHNAYNASIAVSVCNALGVKDSVIKKALKDFKGVPGRLEFIRNAYGRKIYNDTTATTPEATIVALRALCEKDKRNVVLIMGGADKNLDMLKLLKEIKISVKSVVLLSGTGTERIKTMWDKMKVPAFEYDDLGDAVLEAMDMSDKGDVILLSPAFASFGMFKNEYDRGEKFNKIVNKI